MTEPALSDARDTGRLWAGLNEGKGEVRGLADPYALLGLIQSANLGAGRGVGVTCVLPGSPLAAAKPALRPGDAVLRVGEAPLGSAEQLKAFRQTQLPAGPVPVLVRRGTRQFEATIDYAGATAMLSKLPATQPTSAETRP
jgi:S1-C subfamily serine protease